MSAVSSIFILDTALVKAQKGPQFLAPSLRILFSIINNNLTYMIEQ
jgi:hypothetical protein